MPTVPEYYAFKEASPAVQDNMTYYYNASASLRTWSANSKAGSSVLSGIFGEIFGEGQSKIFLPGNNSVSCCISVYIVHFQLPPRIVYCQCILTWKGLHTYHVNG